MTKEKAVLTREQAIWIEGMRRLKKADYDIIDEVLVGRASRPILALGIPKLSHALYVGYTVEETQEEREADVKEYYDALAFGSDRYAVECTLDLLGIHIEGVTKR